MDNHAICAAGAFLRFLPPRGMLVPRKFDFRGPWVVVVSWGTVPIKSPARPEGIFIGIEYEPAQNATL